MATKFSENSEDHKTYFSCELCDYKCIKKQHLKQHFLTKSHKIKEFNGVENSVNHTFICICGKSYKDRSGLWKHKNKCMNNMVDDNKDVNKDDSNYEENNKSEITPELIKLITELVKGQHGLQESIIELCKNGTVNNSTNTNTTNSHNKSFNLQFFLNETCKDAMNIMDFVDSIQLQLSDLERVGEIGYVEGISNIIINNLDKLDVTQRPVHCTDKKREVLYIKDEGAWEKEDEDNKKMRKVVKRIANKNMKLLNSFREKYPDCNKCEFKQSDKYNKLIIEAMGGLGGNDFEKENKIIRNISKKVIIDK